VCGLSESSDLRLVIWLRHPVSEGCTTDRKYKVHFIRVFRRRVDWLVVREISKERCVLNLPGLRILVL
jgi:hypothetical protein